MNKAVLCGFGVVLLFLCSGCARGLKVSSSSDVGRPETIGEQLDAAQKVIGAMADQEISDEDMKRLAGELRSDEEARSAVESIMGLQEPVVIKYSPVTGKHYSGDMNYDPETGVKLEVLEQ